MSVYICLFAGSPSPYLDEPLGGRSTLQRVSEYVSSLSPDSVTVLSAAAIDGIPGTWKTVVQDTWTVADLVSQIAGLVNDPNDTVLFAYLDQPFLNREITDRLLQRHKRNFADYTFADGYPGCLAPEVLRGRCLDYVRELSAGDLTPVNRTTLFSVIQKDMNRFDIETELSERDQRLLRLTLAVDTRANLLVCHNLATGAPESIDSWPDHVEKDRVKHRTLPRYVSVQVIEQDVHEVSYSPYPSVYGQVLAPGAIMTAERFDSLVDQIHGLSPEAVVSISLWGEVSLHPEVVALIDSVVTRPPLRLVVETSGIGWKAQARDELFSRAGLDLIVGLDSHDPALYRSVRGEGLGEAEEFVHAALEANPDTTHVQAVRCDLTDPALEEFYKYWKEHTPNVIIQKYDSFVGRLPNRALSDLSPLHRFPCWHLQRDVSVLVDGTAPLCREDLLHSVVLGNVFDDGFENVWKSGEERYREHTEGRYPGICEACDEYYTFNF